MTYWGSVGKRVISTWQTKEGWRYNLRIYLYNEEKLCKASVKTVILQATVWTCELLWRKCNCYRPDCGIWGKNQLKHSLSTHTEISELKICLREIKLMIYNTEHFPTLNKKVNSIYFQVNRSVCLECQVQNFKTLCVSSQISWWGRHSVNMKHRTSVPKWNGQLTTNRNWNRNK